MDQSKSQKNLESTSSSTAGITDQIRQSLTNSGHRSVERGPRLDFSFDFAQFREGGILRIGNALQGPLSVFDFHCLSLPQAPWLSTGC